MNLILRNKFLTMKQYQFKTNINCSGCVEKVTPVLDQNKGISDWKVDTNNPNKILTVETESLNEEQVKEIVQKAGFKAEKIN